MLYVAVASQELYERETPFQDADMDVQILWGAEMLMTPLEYNQKFRVRTCEPVLLLGLSSVATGR